MKRFFLHSLQGRIILILLLFMTVSLFGTFVVVQTFSQRIMTSEKAGKLSQTASLLDFQLGDRSYESILIENGAENGSWEEKVAVLNSELSAFGDTLTDLYPDLGIGYYSLEIGRAHV